MFYLIEKENGAANFHKFVIQEEAPVYNLSDETWSEGLSSWLGTTNDLAEFCLGQYPTLDAAEDAAQERLEESNRCYFLLDWEDTGWAGWEAYPVLSKIENKLFSIDIFSDGNLETTLNSGVVEVVFSDSCNKIINIPKNEGFIERLKVSIEEEFGVETENVEDILSFFKEELEIWELIDFLETVFLDSGYETEVYKNESLNRLESLYVKAGTEENIDR